MNFISTAKVFLSGVFSSVSVLAAAQAPNMPEQKRENFMVVVRESIGTNKVSETLTPMGKAKAKLADGNEIEFELASWQFIGDTHVRFVFDGPTMMSNATPQDLERLGIRNVDDALKLALENIRRTYGEPKTMPWTGGLMSVEGNSPDLNSSYFLDRPFWQSVLRKHPEGIVVCVAKRGGLLYTPLSDTKAVENLKRGVAYLYTSSENQRISSGLYLFKDNKWSVFQTPIAQ
jgi:hypothetical protein